MTAQPLLTLPPDQPTQARASEMVEIIRNSWTEVEPKADELAKHFYAVLFQHAPETRELFPANMQVQRSRLLRALVHVVQMVDRPGDLTPFLAQLGRDHRKFGVIAKHYDAVGFALLSALEYYLANAWIAPVEKAWTDAYGLIASAMGAAADAERGPASWLGRVVGHRRLSWDVAMVQVQTGEPIPYQAGQYLSVETPRRPRLWRYLSPANAPRPDGVIEFHVRAVDGGWVSRAIVAHTQRGDTWRIGPPMGRMAVNRKSGRNQLMVVGGTGMAPIKAILDDMSRYRENPRTEVFVGGRNWDELYDFGSLRQLSYTNPWLNVVPVVEEDDEGQGAERGTLADVVTRYGAWKDHDVLVCGSPTMIRATVSRMLVAGTPLDQIRYDPFTMD
ncbi:globin domain-containing protein [Pseudonocardia sp.]|jgi:NAD(P)H-flavin reductase/hemoglobin-like flavoprotein|uniref:globin domain-containing protein n=1 Tax=Pseudonocardia sp. TaxID=60912 RepID=UPI0039C9AE9D